MLFDSSLRKELGRSFGGTLLVLLMIVSTMMLIRTLQAANRGSVNPQEVTLVLGYTLLGYLPLLLTLSLFIAVVSTLSRMYADHEMEVWLSSGRGLFSFLKPLFRFAWPVLLVIAFAAFVVWPWSHRQNFEMRQRFEQRGDLDRVAAGQFQESSDGRRVFFIDKDSEGSTVGRNVFIWSTDREREAVTSAKSGELVTLDESRYLLLKDGQRMELDPKTQELRVTDFREAASLISSAQAASLAQRPTRSLSTPRLWRESNPVNLGELAWRIGMGVAAINFIVLALAVSSVNPRASRSVNLIIALLSFVIYLNLINLGQAWVANGRVVWSTYLLGLHGSVLIASLLWLWKRHTGWSIRDALGRRAQKATA